MSKQSGLGDNFYIHGYDVSGDVQSLSRIAGGPAALDQTAINASAMERNGGLRSGGIEFVTFFNDAALHEHAALSGLPRTDVIMSYFRGTTLGNPAASLVGKQLNYDGNRADDGGFTLTVEAQSNGYGIEWGRSLTAGVRTDTTATNGTSIDTTASASFGGQAYLHVFAFTGTDVTIKIQDSANNSAFADVTGFGFTVVTAAPYSQRIALGSTDTLRRYLRVVTTTSAGFTSAAFAVNVVKNEAATVF